MWCSITSKETKIMKQYYNDNKIMAHIFLSCVVIAVLLILSVHPAMADYNFDGVPEIDELEEVEQGTVEGGVYIGGDDPIVGPYPYPSPYTKSFNVPGDEIIWARLYVGVWGGNEENTGSVAVTFNDKELETLELEGETDTNSNVYCSGHGVYWIYYDVTDNTTSGPIDAVVTTSGDIDGRVYGVVLVAVYEESDGEKVEYWINDGNVNLHGEGQSGEFKPNDEALANFSGTVDVDEFVMARLTTVYLTGTPGEKDYLYFNDNKLCDGDNCDDIANLDRYFDFKTFDVIDYIEKDNNEAKFERGDEDYLHPVLAVLTLHTEEEGDSDLTVSNVSVLILYAGSSNTISATNGYAFTSILVNNVTDLGSGNITVTYNTSVVHVTNVTSGDGNALAVQDWNVDNSTGSVQIFAQDADESHNGDVVFANVTFHAVGEYPDSTPLVISSSELINYTSYDIIGHSVTNGTFSIIDIEPPVITDAIATSDVILNDNGRPRIPGTGVTALNATVLDSESGVANITIDLSSIGGSDDQVMERIAGTDVWTVATNATDGINLTHELVVTASDGFNNTNTSVIGLTVLLRGDVVRDGDVNSADALYIAKYLVGKEPMPSLLVSDMQPAEGDGKITSADALYLAKYLVGKEVAP